ncbi:MAG: Xaa-Pro dipeptidase, partial [Pseudomonadales bacterium]|nr:Xaa-Pro dipeptidase [Pseudomonadales bacterium]
MLKTRTDVDALYPAHISEVSARYRRALEALGKRAFLIPSGSLKYTFQDDHTYPFVVNPHFKSWLPLTNAPDCFLLVGDGRPRLFYHQSEDYWHLPPADPTGFWVDEFDIHPIQDAGDIHNLLGDTRELAFIGEETAFADSLGIKSINPDAALAAIHFDRAYKTPYELGCMQLANIAAAQGHLAAEAAFRLGKSEFDIQAD